MSFEERQLREVSFCQKFYRQYKYEVAPEVGLFIKNTAQYKNRIEREEKENLYFVAHEQGQDDIFGL